MVKIDVCPKNTTDEIKLDNWAMRFPTHTGDVAGALSALVAKLIAKDAGAAGVFHFSGTEAMTKCVSLSFCSCWVFIGYLARTLQLECIHPHRDVVCWLCQIL